jgi:hypothetical protein
MEPGTDVGPRRTPPSNTLSWSPDRKASVTLNIAEPEKVNFVLHEEPTLPKSKAIQLSLVLRVVMFAAPATKPSAISAAST